MSYDIIGFLDRHLELAKSLGTYYSIERADVQRHVDIDGGGGHACWSGGAVIVSEYMATKAGLEAVASFVRIRWRWCRSRWWLWDEGKWLHNAFMCAVVVIITQFYHFELNLIEQWLPEYLRQFVDDSTAKMYTGIGVIRRNSIAQYI